MHLIAKRACDSHVPSVNSISVTIHARVSIFSLKYKQEWCLSHFECHDSKFHSKNECSLEICGICFIKTWELRRRSDALINSFEIDGMNMHMFCLSEHHMKEHLTLPAYVLTMKFLVIKS
jgi:hypothetical protein